MAPSTHGSIESIVLNNNHCELLQFILDQHKPKSESDRDCKLVKVGPTSKVYKRKSWAGIQTKLGFQVLWVLLGPCFQ